MIEERHLIAGARLQARQAQRRHQGVVRHAQLANEENRLRFIRADDAMGKSGSIRHIYSPHAVMDHVAPLFMQGPHIFGIRRAFFIGAHRIQLKAHMTEQRRQAAEGDTMLAEGGMTVAIATMRAHYLGWKEVAHAALDGVAPRASLLSEAQKRWLRLRTS